MLVDLGTMLGYNFTTLEKIKIKQYVETSEWIETVELINKMKSKIISIR
jgi:hypothetical protein